MEEENIQGYTDINKGNSNYLSLRNKILIARLFGIDINQAGNILENPFYMGDKHPNMWWEKFEIDLMMAFETYDKNEGRQVHFVSTRLWILLNKIGTDLMSPVKFSVIVDL